jgi:hypothetical protein
LVTDNNEERASFLRDASLNRALIAEYELILCGSDDCESLIYQIGLEHLRVPFLVLCESLSQQNRSKYLAVDLDLIRLLESKDTLQPYKFERKRIDLEGIDIIDLDIDNYSHF